MLSVAGGWFYLTVSESFTLGDKSFRLLGLGSFMSLAAEKGDYFSMLIGGLCMVVILLVADFFLWNPLLRWAQRFQGNPLSMEEEDEPVLNFFTKSKRITSFLRKLRRRHAIRFYVTRSRRRRKRRNYMREWQIVGYCIFAVAVGFCAWALFMSVKMLSQIPIKEWVQILKCALYTSLRVNIVVALSAVTMIPLGLWLGAKPLLVKKLKPIIQLLAAFPAPMIFPLFIVVFLHLSIPMSLGSIILMMTGAQWYLLFNVLSGSASIPENLVEMAKTTGINTLGMINRVYLPASFPHVLTGLVTAAGGAWNTCIVAELVMFRGQEFITPGLGSYITKSATNEKYPELTAAVLVMVVIVVITNRFFWARLYQIAETKYRLD